MTPELRRWSYASGTKPLAWMTGILIALITAAFVLFYTLPDNVAVLQAQTAVGLTVADGSRANPTLVALGVLSGLAVLNFVVGIITGADFRSYLGAGVTRRDTFVLAQESHVIVALVSILLAAATFAVAALLGGSMEFTATSIPLPAAIALNFLSYIALAEIGYLISALFIRYPWYVGVAIILAIVFGSSFFDESSGVLIPVGVTTLVQDHPYAVAVGATVLAAAAAAAISFLLVRRLPMRRS